MKLIDFQKNNKVGNLLATYLFPDSTTFAQDVKVEEAKYKLKELNKAEVDS